MADVTRETLRERDGQVGGGSAETSHHPRTDPERDDKDYYGIPPIKKAHWTWEIPIYFWIGGLTAGTHLFSTVAQLLGHEDKALVRTSRYSVLVFMLLSPILLISDLGRPERFYNMLRIVKLRSPMNTQSWALTIFGQLSGLIAAKQAAEDGLLGHNFLSRLLITLIPARLLAIVALPFALYIGANTGILISATSVPIWARNWLLNGPTFLSSGVSTALSFLSFVLHLGHWGQAKTLRVLRRAERLVILIEAALIATSMIRMGRWGKPLRSKEIAPLYFGGALLGGVVAPLALLFGRETRNKSLLTSTLVLLGGLAFRFSIILAGRKSADDPEAYFTFAKKEIAPEPGDSI
jgi:formate-dependent nitrite reductase membrane component NrfD